MIDFNKVSDLPEVGLRDVVHRFAMQHEELPGVGPFATAPAGLGAPFFDNLYHASDWMVLAREACCALTRAALYPELLAPFKGSLLACETAIPSLLLNGSLAVDLNIHRRNVTFVAYPHLSGTDNLTFTEDNFYSAIAEGYLFIRKRPDILPQSVALLLSSRAKITSAKLESLLQTGKTGALETVTQPQICDARWLTEYMDALKVAAPSLRVENANDAKHPNTPRLYFDLSFPEWADIRVSAKILSEDCINFKIMIIWLKEFQGHADFDLIRVGPYITSLTKARVHGVAFGREVIIDDDTQKGFYPVHSARDHGNLRSAINSYLEYGESFCRCLRNL